MTITYTDGRAEQLQLLVSHAERARRGPCPQCAGVGVLSATDIFCGAGGSSLGLELVCCPACGRSLISVTYAINHWDLAVKCHECNFPATDHDVHDVAEIPPSRFRRTDILWVSPECTNHTDCKGAYDDTPEAIRSRATANDVVRFTAYHRYAAVVVENVVEFRRWCEHPAVPNGKGGWRRCNCGATFDQWYAELRHLGYEGQIVYWNSQCSGAPQSRDRMYVVLWRSGIPAPRLGFTPVSWCPSCSAVVHGIQAWKRPSRGSFRERVVEWGRYGANYLYLCPNEGCGQPVAPAVVGARSIIDFALPIQRIGDRRDAKGRPRPLAVNTRQRIRVGVVQNARHPPMLVAVGGHLFERAGSARVWSVESPMPTVTTSQTMALVTAERHGAVPGAAEAPTPAVTGRAQLGLVTPAGGQDAAARTTGEPMHTVVGSDRLAVVVRAGGQAPSGRAVDEPMGTITAHDRQIALVVPGGGETPETLVMQNMANNVPRPGGAPAPPVTTAAANHMLVQVNRGPKHAGDARGGGRTLEQPTRTIAGHGELGLVEFRGDYGTVRDGDRPLHTVTAQGHHHGMLVYNGRPGFVRSLRDAAGTITARDKQALLVPYYRTGVARAVDEPMGAVTSRDREALVVTDAEIDDFYFRMLQWQELQRAQMMARRPDGTPYVLRADRVNRRGRMVELSNEDKTKMIGNAVTSGVARDIGWPIAEALWSA